MAVTMGGVFLTCGVSMLEGPVAIGWRISA